MKKLTTIMMTIAVAFFLMVGSAMADFLPTDADYWYTTDFTTNETGNSGFQLMQTTANPEYSFGLYSRADHNIYLEVIASNTQPGLWNEVSVAFAGQGNNTTAHYNDKTVALEGNGAFGFYFGYTVTTEAGKEDMKYYTDASLNEEGIDPISIKYDQVSTVQISLSGYNPQLINGSDLNPVPEPSTMLLMGVGLLGLAGYSRKRFAKKS